MRSKEADYARKAVVTGEVISDEILPARAYWHKRLDRGTILRIVDLEGCQSVDTLIYDAADTAIRYNAANTMKLAGSDGLERARHGAPGYSGEHQLLHECSGERGR
jgi:uncharacterized protein YcgI (DUF1989 family)